MRLTKTLFQKHSKIIVRQHLEGSEGSSNGSGSSSHHGEGAGGIVGDDDLAGRGGGGLMVIVSNSAGGSSGLGDGGGSGSGGSADNTDHCLTLSLSLLDGLGLLSSDGSNEGDNGKSDLHG